MYLRTSIRIMFKWNRFLTENLRKKRTIGGLGKRTLVRVTPYERFTLCVRCKRSLTPPHVRYVGLATVRTPPIIGARRSNGSARTNRADAARPAVLNISILLTANRYLRVRIVPGIMTRKEKKTVMCFNFIIPISVYYETRAQIAAIMGFGPAVFRAGLRSDLIIIISVLHLSTSSPTSLYTHTQRSTRPPAPNPTRKLDVYRVMPTRYTRHVHRNDRVHAYRCCRFVTRPRDLIYFLISRRSLWAPETRKAYTASTCARIVVHARHRWAGGRSSRKRPTPIRR